ncbi:MAG: glycosyltransferase, partial [Bacteroidia bacterium]|nr:glycosyltransferase [Bacteroidia bacterium]
MRVDRIPVLNIYLDNWTRSAFIATLAQGVVFTPNLDHLSLLQRRRDFYEAYLQASHVVCDSRILLIAARLLGWPVADQIAGADLLPAWCQAHG